MGEIFLIADTNLFFECRDLKELDWQAFGTERIVIVVCKPVQEEIDKHKNGSGRTKRQALKYGRIFREMLKSGSFDKSIEHTDVDIVLRLDPLTQPSADLNQLDYTANDNRVVGIAKSYIENLGAGVLLLTHDTGPSATAHGVGVPYHLIPDDWLRPVEENPELAQAIRRIEAFEKQEPAFEFIVDQFDEGKILFGVPECKPPTATDLDELIETIKNLFPMATEFPDQPQPSLPNMVAELLEYQRPSDEDIERYKERDYPKWLEECREVFERSPEVIVALEPQINLSVKILNTGNRPAEMSKVRFETDGHVLLRRPENNDEQRQDAEDFQLPNPPSAPVGRWVSNFQSAFEKTIYGASSVSGYSQMAKAHRSALQSLHNPLSTISSLTNVAETRDPESFFWRGSPDEPSTTVEFECQSWRHNSDTQEFIISAQPVEGGNSGLVRCSVVANNLTHKSSLNIPVRFEKRPLSAVEYCSSLIERLRTTQLLV